MKVGEVQTALAPEGCDAQWEGLRGWCEQSFKCIKRGGWQWQQTQMTDLGADGAAAAGAGGGEQKMLAVARLDGPAAPDRHGRADDEPVAALR